MSRSVFDRNPPETRHEAKVALRRLRTKDWDRCHMELAAALYDNSQKSLAAWARRYGRHLGAFSELAKDYVTRDSSTAERTPTQGTVEWLSTN